MQLITYSSVSFMWLLGYSNAKENTAPPPDEEAR